MEHLITDDEPPYTTDWLGIIMGGVIVLIVALALIGGASIIQSVTQAPL